MDSGIIVDLSHDGKEWTLNLTNDESIPMTIQIPVTDKQKGLLESIGVGIYNPDL